MEIEKEFEKKILYSSLSAQTPAWPAGGPAFLPPFSLFFSARPAASALRPAHRPSPRGLPRARKSQAQLAPTACHAQAPACSVRRCTPFSPFPHCAPSPTPSDAHASATRTRPPLLPHYAAGPACQRRTCLLPFPFFPVFLSFPCPGNGAAP